MKNLLIVVDMQNDFITGALGTGEARAILPDVVKLVESWDGPVAFTRDTAQSFVEQVTEEILTRGVDLSGITGAP